MEKSRTRGDQLTDNREAEPSSARCPRLRLVDAVEAVEDVRKMSGINPGTGQ